MNIRFFAVLVFVATLSIDLNCTLTERLESVSSEAHRGNFNSQNDCRSCCQGEGFGCTCCGTSL